MADAGGTEMVEGIKNSGNGLLIAQLEDADGNVVGLMQPS